MSQLSDQLLHFQQGVQNLAVKSQLKRLRLVFYLMTEEQYDRYENMLLGIDAKLFSDEEMNELELKLAERNAANELLNLVSSLNSKGMAAEKAGDIDGAIGFYEENINLGYRASHSFNRLMIIYRKRRLYEEEIRVISEAKKVFSLDEDYLDELNRREIKTRRLLDKNKPVKKLI